MNAKSLIMSVQEPALRQYPQPQWRNHKVQTDSILFLHNIVEVGGGGFTQNIWCSQNHLMLVSINVVARQHVQTLPLHCRSNIIQLSRNLSCFMSCICKNRPHKRRSVHSTPTLFSGMEATQCVQACMRAEKDLQKSDARKEI